MQHLRFLPQTPVPFLGGPIYEGEGLEAFVKKWGWSQARLQFGTDPDDDPEKATDDNLENRAARSRLAFLQSCFNVAIVVEFLKIGGVDASHETFCPNGAVIDTTDLPRLMEKMGAGVLPAHSDATGDQTRRVTSILELTCSCMPLVFPDTTDAISIPIQCMFHTIFMIAHKLGMQSGLHKLDKRMQTAGQRINKRLIEEGWCPRQVSELDTLNLITTRHYISTIKRTPKFTDHTQCMANRCVFSHIDSSTYLTAHVCPCSGCRFISIDQEDLLILLKQNIVPRISIEILKNASPQPELKLVVRGSGDYIAISHVWSHGLGNPCDNSLPTCQLRRIHSLIEEVNESTRDQPVGAFWIDTLCVPHNKGAKQRALSFIRRTFSESTNTLILDYEIERIPPKTPSHEIMWRLAISDWARRLWTYEEFVVSEMRVLLKLCDGILSFPELVRDFYKGRTDRLTYQYNPLDMLESTDECFTFVLFNLQKEKHRMHLVCHLLTKAGKLSTSRSEDEFLCLASMLDLETETIAALPAEKRVECFLAKLEWLPIDILFGYSCRSKTPGCRWTPASFLVDHGGADGFDADFCGQYRPIQGDNDVKGFAVSLPGFELTKHASRIKSRCFLQVPDAPLRCFQYCKPQEDPFASRIERLRGLHKEEDLASPRIFPMGFKPTMKLILKNENQCPTPAILVHSASKTFDGAECVEYVAMIEIGDLDDPSPITEEDGSSVENGKVVHAVPIPKTHRWCIT